MMKSKKPVIKNPLRRITLVLVILVLFPTLFYLSSEFAALNEYGCFRLASRISELKAEGHNITTRMVSNREGKNYAEYKLHRKKQQTFDI